MFRADHQLRRCPKSGILRQLAVCGHQISISIQESFKNHCPSCRIEAYMRTIHECQYAIAQEGGIFESKKTAEHLGALSAHRHWLRKWRRAKVKLLWNIDMIEDLLEKHRDEDIITQGTRVVLRKALNLYEEEKEELMFVPGWTPARVKTNQTPQKNPCSEKSNPEKNNISQKDPEMSIGSHARLIAKDEVPRVALPPTTPDTSKLSTRRLRFSQTVTVSPNASSSSSKPTNQVHSPHTAAELASNRRSWWRKGHIGPLDRAWSSPQGYEKVQTSWYRKSFDEMELDVSATLFLEETLDEETLDEEALDEEALDEEALDKVALIEVALIEVALGEATLDPREETPESVGKESLSMYKRKRGAKLKKIEDNSEDEELLLPGVERVIDGKGRTSYFDLDKKCTLRDKPIIEVGKEALPAGWEARKDRKTSRVYYFDDSTKQTTWNRPVPEAV